jgi:polar amino acid transport system permease protein
MRPDQGILLQDHGALRGDALSMEEWLFIQNEVYPALLKGFWVSLQLIIPSSILGLIIGILVGVLRVYGSRPITAAANTYVALFRGIPLVVQLFIWYFGLPYLKIYLTPFVASVLGFALCSGATTPST